MDSTTDPLQKSERLLREILEGQRLSRLDGVVFLSCPLLVAGITFLANQIQQLRFSDKIDFIFHGLSLLLMILILGYVAWGFIAYVRSSLASDIKGRARSCRKLLWGFFGLVYQCVIWFVAPILVPMIPSLPLNIVSLLGLVSMNATFALTDLEYGLVSKSNELFMAWIMRNAPTSFKGTESEVENLSVETRAHFARIRRDLTYASVIGAATLVYAMMQAVRDEGLVFLETLTAVLVILAIMMIWGSRLQNRFGHNARHKATLLDYVNSENNQNLDAS